MMNNKQPILTARIQNPIQHSRVLFGEEVQKQKKEELKRKREKEKEKGMEQEKRKRSENVTRRTGSKRRGKRN